MRLKQSIQHRIFYKLKFHEINISNNVKW